MTATTPALDPARLRIAFKAFDDLSLRELYALMVLRNEVFVVGQRITAEPEVDGLDPECVHVLCHDEDTLIGTARIFAARDPVVVGRIAIARERQRGGFGTWMMQRIQEHLGDHTHAEMHAQAYLEGWYSRLGWRRQGEPFVEAEIPHITMIWGEAAQEQP